ncbi:Rib/alpha-like domain-containing protein [Winkia neuii]|uniref:Rib/alpha-like domain-containing protein n=1 Tax=Winkia neuii TaxID=33007 RepID=UPI0023A96EA6|nr:Rib/alpha-like domain-containing protein [Winkia neuii]WEB72769.1 Rib/alpha-like domain-containing protein [Winkia neuii]
MSLKRNPLIFTPRPLAAGLGAVALTAGGLFMSPVVNPVAFAENTPISSPGQYQAAHTVSGQVFLDRSGARGLADSKQTWSAYNDADTPLPGVNVYVQWMDDDSAKTVSPIYTATSAEDGKYSIELPDWTDSLGNKHKWKANSTQKLRVWSDNPDDSKYMASFSEGFQTFHNSVQRVHATWRLARQSAVDYNVSFQERPQNDVMHLPEDKQTNLTPTKTGGDVLGRVWWDQRNVYGEDGDVPRLNTGMGDKPMEGMKVRASYVQDEVARRFDKWLAANKGATQDQFRDAQKQIMAQYEEENPGKSAIAETAYALTKADGSYQIQFQGLWGDSYSYKGISNGGTYGDLAPADKGSWAKGNFGSKHVNTKYMYVSPEIPEGVGGSMDTMQTNMFQDAGRNTLLASSNAISGVIDMDFALKLENRKFDVVEYDSTDKLATPGDTANTEASGFNPEQDYDVIWTDSTGKQVGKCTVTSSSVGKIESCPFTVPDDLDQAQIYTATIYPKGDTTTALAADNFAATPDPQYKKIEVEAGDSGTVAVPLTKAGNPLHEGTTFASPTAEELPEGMTAAPEWATVNADGSISAKPGADVEPGEYKVPVVVTYPDGSTDTVEVPVKVGAADKPVADSVDPKYEDVSVKAGESVSVAAPKDADGNALPEGSKFAPGEGVPEWATVNADGSISAKPGADVEPGEYKVPVVVTYPDGSTDTVEVPVKVGAADKPVADSVDPKYEDVSVKAGESVSVAAPKDADGNALPEGSKFAPGEGVPEWATVNADGSISAKPGADVEPGEYKVPVVVTYPDGSTDTVEVPVKVGAADKPVADSVDPKYEDVSVKAGESVSVAAPKDADGNALPEGSKFAPGEGVPEWATVNADGSISAKPGADVEPGEYKVPVVVTYPDGSTDTVEVPVKVGAADKPVADSVDPKYEDVSVKAGESVSVAAPKDADGNALPEGSKFAPGEGVPEWATVNADGSISAKPGADVEPGEYKVPVVVTYPDGSTDTVEVPVKVGAADKPVADSVDPKYEDVSVKAGESVSVAAPKDADGNALPEGSKFAPGEGVPEWATVNADGSISAKPGADVEPGEYKVPVVVTYPDGSTDTVEVPVKVGAADKPVDPEDTSSVVEPVYPPVKGDTSSEVPTFVDGDGNEVDKPAAGEGQDEVKFDPGEDAPDGAQVDPDSGVVTIPEVPAKGEDPVVVPVVVTYPDGTTDTTTVKFEPEPAEEGQPSWDSVELKPGEETSIPNKGEKISGATVETEGPGTAQIDDEGNIKVLADQDAKPGDRITVTVKDRSGKIVGKLVVTIAQSDKPSKPEKPGKETSTGNGGHSETTTTVVGQPSLASTGTAVLGYGAASVALLLAGAGIVAYSRRRKE